MNTRALRTATAKIEGRGIHGGRESSLRILPAEPGRGLRFRRIDLAGSPELGRADLVNTASEGGRTTLQSGDAKVQTVEHVCAAIWGLGIDDAVVEVDGIEPPAADGSALPFARAMIDAGIEDTGRPRPAFRPTTVLSHCSEGATISVLPAKSGLTLSYLLDYPGEPLARGRMEIGLAPDTFLQEIAPARTFCPAAQVEKFLALGWGRGADTTNTLILEGDSVRDNTLRFPDEPLRHKLLDLIGDLAFIGGELVGKVRACRSGHANNRAILSQVLTACEKRNGGEYVIDVNEIRKMLPHRYPFLLVDRILEVEPGKRAVGFKNLTVNEEFFQGHFPNVPVMPGVLQIEAMAQVGGILLARTLDEGFGGKIAVLAGVDKAKLRRAVVPGDQLVMEVTVDRLKRSFGQVFAKATVDGQVAAEATIKFAIVSPQDLGGSSKS